MPAVVARPVRPRGSARQSNRSADPRARPAYNGAVNRSKALAGTSDPAKLRGVDWATKCRTADLYAGIGGMRLGFASIGGRCVFASEWDERARATYANYFDEEPTGDIEDTAPEAVPEHDVLLAGFPCQAFSIIGSRMGFADTRGTQFFNVERILKAKRPGMLLLENVKHFRTHDGGRTFETVIRSLNRLGYHTHSTVLNALDFGLPQRRERTFIVGFQDNVAFDFPTFHGKHQKLSKLLENDDEVDQSLTASDHIKHMRRQRLALQGKDKPTSRQIWHENKGGDVSTHDYSCALRAYASYSYLLVDGQRRLSPRELLRLQGFPEDFEPVGSYSTIRAQTGNSVAVPVVKAIAKAAQQAILDHLADDIAREHRFNNA